jgi:hypothetical protein
LLFTLWQQHWIHTYALWSKFRPWFNAQTTTCWLYVLEYIKALKIILRRLIYLIVTQGFKFTLAGLPIAKSCYFF